MSRCQACLFVLKPFLRDDGVFDILPVPVLLLKLHKLLVQVLRLQHISKSLLISKVISKVISKSQTSGAGLAPAVHTIM